MNNDRYWDRYNDDDDGCCFEADVVWWLMTMNMRMRFMRYNCVVCSTRYSNLCVLMRCVGVFRYACMCCMLLTGFAVVMRVDRTWRVTVCVTVHRQILVSSAAYSLRRRVVVVVDALERRRVVWPIAARLRRILGANVIGSYTQDEKDNHARRS